MRLVLALVLLVSGLPGMPDAGAQGFVQTLRQAVAQPVEEELLPPDEAFRAEVTARDGQTLEARFSPAKGYYLYRDKFAFGVIDSPGIQLAGVEIPPGKPKDDPLFGKVDVFFEPVQVLVRLQRSADAAGPVRLKAAYQGCNEPIGVCYPPIEKVFEVALPAAAAAGTAVPVGEAGPLSEDDRVAGLLKGGSFWLIVVSFLGFGLLLAFTPCVFPMIPILSGIIAGQGHALTKARGFTLALAYVIGMAITYALAGVAAGLSGTLLSATLQNPWVLGTFAALFVLLALSMFGFYELQLPASLQSRLADTTNRLGGGHYAGVFAMGALSAVIVGPCVAAPLAGALLYISQTRDVVLGGVALFAMAIGMGLPLLAVGASAGAVLPKAGPWMETVKRFFGVLLLGVAIYMISPVIPAVVHMLAWAALLIVSAIYLHAIDPLPPDAPGYRKFWKGIGVIVLLVGVSLLVGALSGGRDVLQPLAGLRFAGGGAAAQQAQTAHLPFERVRSLAELEARLQAAAGRYVMLDFYADWCVSCKEMERFTFSDPRVQAKLRDVVLLQADVTRNTPEDAALLKRFNLFGPPGILFFDRQGREIPGTRVVGFQKADQFLATLERAMP
ncbi:protein-disulfide reductase DsbD [Pelomicrobium methylotrophicum]|uniref:Thiol:disulfide interchange protein DsbD n=1 Tax=Pelomicrobium methylotrophicum TaxID=2602750 RepID=A0A5C7EUW8_9PROT|nr:protein-disulfide reductase DsbD [Pelomicrobium methylotrophicum]TXF10816.1 protein-disulfide reductase DsbD [Pelomicrobium methylotrophicum]